LATELKRSKEIFAEKLFWWCYKPSYSYASEFTSIRAEMLLKALWVDCIGYVRSETNMDSSV